VPAALRRLVRERAALQCEYCLLAEDDAFLPHEPDHIVTVTLLRLNLPARVEVREELASLGRWPLAPRAP
jgi:hypothetical protein